MTNPFERWSERYRAVGEDYLFGEAPNRFLQDRAGRFTTGQSLLSVADGEGRNSVWLARQGLSVTAIELTEAAVVKARRLAARHGVAVRFEIGDMLAPDWPPAAMRAAFDWVVGIFIQFTSGSERERQLQAMQAATCPGGRILLLGYTPRQLAYRTGGPSQEENLYTQQILAAHFADWAIEELVEYEDDIAEGSGHCGRSALIGLVARRPAMADGG